MHCKRLIHPDLHTVTAHPLVGIYYTGPIKYHADHQTLLLAAGSRVVAAYEAYGDMRRDKFRTTWPLGPKRPEGPPASWDRSRYVNHNLEDQHEYIITLRYPLFNTLTHKQNIPSFPLTSESIYFMFNNFGH